MRILRLTKKTERALLKARLQLEARAHQAAARIVDDVRRRGDTAVDHWARKLDDADVRGKRLWISPEQMKAARSRVDVELLRAIEHAARNVRRVAERQLPQEWTFEVEPGVTVRQLVRPLDSVGCYVPGGRFALLSTLVMTVVAAQAAGVRRIVAVCPRPNDALLATASVLGVREFARVGGAHAIAALAYGTRRIPPVEKICGPGNKYVTAAKQIVSADCAIDMPAGPTEAVVLAAGGNAAWIASDLLAQAEHAADAGSFLVTPSSALAKAVQKEIEAQLKKLPAGNPAHASVRKSGAILLVRSMDEGCSFVNRFAPEHLSLPQNGEPLLDKIQSAGTIFLGARNAQPFGDYMSGSNHVLPTGGWARRRGGLSAADFVKCVNVQQLSDAGFHAMADGVKRLAEAEGLTAHARAVEARR